MPFDISSILKPLNMTLPYIGAVSLRIRTVAFLSWFEDGERQKRWSDGPAFLRTLLTDRAVPPEMEEGKDGPGPPSYLVDELALDQLEAIAAGLLSAAAPTFSSLRKEPKPDDALSALPDPLDPNAASMEQLLASARAYDADYRAGRKLSADQFARALGTDWVTHEIRRHEVLAATLRPYEGLAGLIGDEHLCALGRIAVGSDHLASSGLLGNVGALSSAHGASAALSKAIALSQGEAAPWNAANRILRLGISDPVLKALSHSEMWSAFGLPPQGELSALLRPGYSSIAALALDGAVERGPASDLLRRYDAVLDAPLFKAVRDAVVALDDLNPSETRRLSLLRGLLTWFPRIAAHARTQYEKAGLVTLLSLIVSVLALYPELMPFHEEPKPSKEMQEAVVELKALRADLRRERDRGDHTRIRYVHDEAMLRAAPGRGGLLLRIVYPDQWVEVRDTSGPWARVAVYDYVSDTPIEGWIYRRKLHVAPE